MYEMMNAPECHAKNPDTFEIPSTDALNTVTKGTNVKVGFVTPDSSFGGERIWVMVTSIFKNGRMRGRINNRPFSKGLKFGQIVSFHRDNILDVFPAT